MNKNNISKKLILCLLGWFLISQACYIPTDNHSVPEEDINGGGEVEVTLTSNVPSDVPTDTPDSAISPQPSETPVQNTPEIESPPEPSPTSPPPPSISPTPTSKPPTFTPTITYDLPPPAPPTNTSEPPPIGPTHTLDIGTSSPPNPKVEVSPKSGPIPTTYTLTIEGFGARENVLMEIILFSNYQVIDSFMVTMEENGNLTTYWTSQTGNPSGLYIVRATGTNNGKTKSGELEIK